MYNLCAFLQPVSGRRVEPSQGGAEPVPVPPVMSGQELKTTSPLMAERHHLYKADKVCTDTCIHQFNTTNMVLIGITNFHLILQEYFLIVCLSE